MFRRVLDRFRPDLVHVHDLGGLPSSLLEIARHEHLPTVLTIHDYHPLCPTVKLYDAYDRICLRTDPGEMCAVCCSDAPRDHRVELAATLWHARQELRRRLPALDAALLRAQGLSRSGAGLIDRLAGAGGSPVAPGPRARALPPTAPPEAYQRRRDTNVERLNRLNGLIASSERSVEIYRSLGVTEAPIVLAPVTPPHIDRLRLPDDRPRPGPLRFGALNAASSTQKGADLLLEAVNELSRRGLDGDFKLLVFGAVAEHVEPGLRAHPSVELRGHYDTEQLDELLTAVDVGLVASVWEEVYGFVTLEFMAKGIPVIGNAVGAVPEHVRPGETGWLCRSCTAAELADLMARAIERPDEVEHLRRSLRDQRDELIEPFDVGLGRLMDVYTQLRTPAVRD